jgi:hypothetical protein
MKNEKSTFVKVINGKALTDLTDKSNLVVMTDDEAKIYNEYNRQNIELIKVRVSLDRLEF